MHERDGIKQDAFRLEANGYEKAQVDAFIFDLLVTIHGLERHLGERESADNVVQLRKAG